MVQFKYGESWLESTIKKIDSAVDAYAKLHGESNMIIDIDMPLGDLMIALGCNGNLIEKASDAHLAAQYQPDGVKIHTTAETPLNFADTGNASQVAPIKLGVLQAVVGGKMPNGSAAKDLARIGLEKAVKHVLNAIGPATLADATWDSIPDGVVSEAVAKEEAEAVKDDLDLKTIFTPPKKATPGFDPVKPAIFKTSGAASGISKLPKVKLKDATQLLQQVSGTDESSVYYCIALSDSLKVAARIKSPNKISIRVEGSGVKTLKSNLLSAGLTDSGSYCSVHLSADSVELARKCVGAVLFGMGVTFNQVSTDLQPIWGKGA